MTDKICGETALVMKKVYEKPEVNYWYAAELDAIETRMSGGGSGGGTYLIGGEGRPEVLTAGKSKSVYAINYWFECTVAGATDFKFGLNCTAAIKIYKKNLTGRTSIKNLSINKNKTVTISKSSINNGINTYVINVRLTDWETFSIRVSQHVDRITKDCENGGRWIPLAASANPDGSLAGCTTYRFCWYTPAKNVSKVYAYVNESTFFDYQQYALDSANAIALVTAGYIMGIGINKLDMVTQDMINQISGTLYFKVISSFIGTIISIPIDKITSFKDNALKTLSKVAEYDSNTGEYNKGIRIQYYMCEGLSFYEFFPWTGSSMEGIAGYTGEWSVIDGAED